MKPEVGYLGLNLDQASWQPHSVGDLPVRELVRAYETEYKGV